MSDVPVLDLSGADSGGFDALDTGTYDATIFSCEWRQTKGKEGAKLPAGTPMLNVQFRVSQEPYENRRVFRSYVIAPVKIGNKLNENKSKSDGILAKFLEDAGYPTEVVKSGDFQINFDDMAGRELRVSVKKKLKYDFTGDEATATSDDYDNEVVGTKPPLVKEAGGIE